MIVKVGNTIKSSLFNGKELTGKVISIEICKRDSKYGRKVKTADISKHHGVIDLDNGHWCYFFQVKEIIK